MCAESGLSAANTHLALPSAAVGRTVVESDESRSKSNESVAESNETGNKSRESILSWASNVLPGTIRADACGNMIKILLEIGLDPKTTTDKMKSAVGISESGVHKILVSELVGFEP